MPNRFTSLIHAHRCVLFILALLTSSFCLGHNGFVLDPFVYNDSGEGEKPIGLSKPGAGSIAGDCIDGLAAGFPCKNINLSATLRFDQMGGGSARLNDIWGWTDPATGTEIAIVGRENGTSFVDVSDPATPVFLGFLPSHNRQSDAWRDIKVYQNHAFIVMDGSSANGHGLQIFDLNDLFNVTPGSTLTETAHLGGFGSAHNIAINEDSGFAYVVGSSSCSGGLYMIDVSTPDNPSFAGCFSADGYTHDAQCLIYQGPDQRFTGAEICVAYNEDTVTIVDVSNKANPVQLSRTPYQGSGYTHQGWFFNDEQRYIITNDELDERGSGSKTTTYIFDAALLDAPTLTGRYLGPTNAIDHNLYSKNNLVYETNYRAGLRVLGEVDLSQGCLGEAAYFDTIPNSDAAEFSGTWSSYIYFASGTIIVSDIGSGLFVLRPDQAAINTEVAMLADQARSCANQPVASPTPPLGNSGGSSGGGVISLYLSIFIGCFLFAYRRLTGKAAGATK